MCHSFDEQEQPEPGFSELAVYGSVEVIEIVISSINDNRHTTARLHSHASRVSCFVSFYARMADSVVISGE